MANPEPQTPAQPLVCLPQPHKVHATMPAWDGKPIVTTHIVDLHAYLSARAQGTQGPGRPLP